MGNHCTTNLASVPGRVQVCEVEHCAVRPPPGVHGELGDGEGAGEVPGGVLRGLDGEGVEALPVHVRGGHQGPAVLLVLLFD